VWEKVINRGRGLCVGRSVMSSKRVCDVVLGGALNVSGSNLLS